MNYDGPFIYAEVNGTKRHWRVENDEHTLIGSDPSSVGCAISTKAVGSDERVDITDQYKFEEGIYVIIIFRMLSFPPMIVGLKRYIPDKMDIIVQQV